MAGQPGWVGFTVPFAAESLSDSSCWVAFSVILHFHLQIERWERQPGAAVFTDTRILQFCPHGTLCCPEQKLFLGVCKCLHIYNISSKGTGFVMSTSSSTAVASVFSASWPTGMENTLNGLYATIHSSLKLPQIFLFSHSNTDNSPCLYW